MLPVKDKSHRNFQLQKKQLTPRNGSLASSCHGLQMANPAVILRRLHAREKKKRDTAE